MPAPAVAIAAAALRNPRRARPARCSALLGAARRSGCVLLIGVFGSIFGLQPLQARLRAVRGRARRDPGRVPRLYGRRRRALRHRPVDPRRDRRDRDPPRPLHRPRRALRRQHATAAAPARCSSRSSARPSTWDSYGVDGNRDGRRSPYDPADAIPAAARYLRASGAPGGLPRARSSPTTTPTGTSPRSSPRPTPTAAPPPARAGSPRRAGDASRELLANPRIVLTPGQRADLRAGGIDPRLLVDARRGSAAATPSSSPRCAPTTTRAPTTRPAARWTSAPSTARSAAAPAPARCADLVRELAAVDRPDSLDRAHLLLGPRRPADPRGFARADHCDHIHWGMDA